MKNDKGRLTSAIILHRRVVGGVAALLPSGGHGPDVLLRGEPQMELDRDHDLGVERCDRLRQEGGGGAVVALVLAVAENPNFFDVALLTGGGHGPDVLLRGKPPMQLDGGHDLGVERCGATAGTKS